MITQNQVKLLFKYKEGGLYWNQTDPKKRSVKNGTRAGSICDGRYRTISIQGKRYYEHRLIFLYHYGYLPKYIDHIDRNILNNDINNLRPASASLNSHNTKSYSKSKLKGVYKKRSGKYQSQISKNGKLHYLGTFMTSEDAHQAYKDAALELYGENSFSC